MSKLTRALDGTGPWSGLAAACWLAGIVMLSAILMSPNGWQWWLDVQSVQGHEQDGLVYYAVDGVQHTIDDPHSFAGSKPAERTVYYVASDPASGSLHNTGNEILDWSLTVGPGALGAGLLVTGFAKRRRIREGAGAGDRPDSYGHGIPEETIRALLSRDGTGRSKP